MFHHLPQIRPSDFEIDNLDLLKASKFSKLLSGNLEKGMLVGRDVVEVFDLHNQKINLAII